MKRIYIAGPYTKSDPAINVHRAIGAGDELAKAGALVFIPHLTHFWHLIYPHCWQFWMDHDMGWLRVCDAVLRLPGESTGADLEVLEAHRLGLPVMCSVDEVLRWLKEQ